jgi:hypothetical protein
VTFVSERTRLSLVCGRSCVRTDTSEPSYIIRSQKRNNFCSTSRDTEPWMPSRNNSSLVALVCRAFYAEHCLGVALGYEDLSEALQPYYYPTNIQDDDGKGPVCGNSLVLVISKSSTFSIKLAHQLIPTSVMDGLSANTSTLYSSTLWPMWNRVTTQAIEECSASVSNDAARSLGFQQQVAQTSWSHLILLEKVRSRQMHDCALLPSISTTRTSHQQITNYN